MEEEKECEVPEESSEERFTINNYEDIFSDFDPRPNSVRGLSEDFLSEIKRATVAKNSEELDFVILVPEKNRQTKEEKIIGERLKRYFKKHYGIEKKEKNKIVKAGIISTFIGVILMFSAAFILYKFKDVTSIITSFLVVLLEPAGWFLFWKGLELALFESKDKTPDLLFYERMVNARIKFDSI